MSLDQQWTSFNPTGIVFMAIYAHLLTNNRAKSYHIFTQQKLNSHNTQVSGFHKTRNFPPLKMASNMKGEPLQDTENYRGYGLSRHIGHQSLQKTNLVHEIILKHHVWMYVHTVEPLNVDTFWT